MRSFFQRNMYQSLSYTVHLGWVSISHTTTWNARWRWWDWSRQLTQTDIFFFCQCDYVVCDRVGIVCRILLFAVATAPAVSVLIVATKKKLTIATKQSSVNWKRRIHNKNRDSQTKAMRKRCATERNRENTSEKILLFRLYLFLSSFFSFCMKKSMPPQWRSKEEE